MITYRLSGRVVERRSPQGVAEVRVEAWDRAEVTTDLIAFAITDADGAFTVSLGQDYLDRHFPGPLPVLSLRLFLSGQELVTRDPQWKLSRAPASLRIEVDLEQTSTQRAPATSLVRGTVRTPQGAPVGHASLRAYDQNLSGDDLLGTGATDELGRYQIEYGPLPRAGKRHPDIVVVASDESGLQIATSERLCHAPATAFVDLVTGAVYRGPSELAQLETRIAAHVQGFLLAKATSAQIDQLVCATGAARGHVVARVAAEAIAETVDVPVPALYALVRKGLPSTRRELLLTRPADLRRALLGAVDDNLLDAAPELVDDIMTQLRKATVALAFEAPPVGATGNLGNLLAKALPTQAAREEFLDAYLSHTGTPEAFWEDLATRPSFQGSGVIASLQLALQIGALARYHFPLVNELWARKQGGQITGLKDLAAYSEAGWIAILQLSQGGAPIGYPSDTPGANAAEKRAAFAKVLKRAMEAAFPTQAIAAAIAAQGADELTTFFNNNASFELGKTRVGDYLAANAGALAGLVDPDKCVLRLKAIERLFKLTPRYEEMKVLLDDGLTSARALVRVGRKRFLAKYGGPLGGTEIAANVFDNAAAVSHHALALHAKLGASYNPSSAYALPDLISQASAPPQAFADYATLFGSPDACACEHCSSVYGPAAYLVDLLHFIDRYDSSLTKSGSTRWTAKELLLGSAPGGTPARAGRRPDIGRLDLTCENADTPLPFVDLVNEILAHAVVGENQAPPAFPDHIATTGTAEELAAMPDPPGNEAAWHAIAYETLSSSVYPWAAPYHLRLDEARVYLQHLGVPRGALMEALRPGSPSAVSLEAIAAERLGLSPHERRVITGAAGVTTAAAWGMSPGAPLPGALLTVPELLKRSGLSYDELLDLLDTAVLARFGAPAIQPAGSCDVEEQTLTGLTDAAGALEMIHRFVRLQRRLGWSIRELDQVLAACAPAGADLVSDQALRVIAVIQALRAERELPIAVLASWFGPLDTQRRDGGKAPSFYEQLFQNKAVTNPVDAALALPGVANLMTDALLSGHTPAILAGLRVSKVELSLLTEDSGLGLPVLVPADPMVPALASLAMLHRVITFSRAARLSVRDFLVLYNLSDEKPFEVGAPERTWSFLKAVDRVRASGLSPADLDYIFRGRASPQASITPADAAVNPVLDQLFGALLALRAANGAINDEAEGALIEEKLRSALKLDAKSTHLLTTTILSTGGSPPAPLRDAFALPAVIPESPPEPAPSLDSLGLRDGQLAAYWHLDRVATLVRRLDLRADELEQMFCSGPASPLDFDALPRAEIEGAGSALFAAWHKLVDLAGLRPMLAGSGASLANLLVTDPASLAAATGWPVADVASLAASLPLALSATDPALQTSNVLRLRDAMAALRRLGVSALQALDWIDPSAQQPSPAAVADAIVRTAKAKYADADWARVAPPLRDVLRERLRAVMVAYLVAKRGYEDSNELFADLLIDVETSPAVITSRLKQAIGSVQTFVQRALLNLEAPDLTLPEEAAREWAWRRMYRVWEANRKVFLHPEAYLDPSLRDDKSPFFKDLESELRQKDITDEAAESALERYLDKLDQVANLDVAAMFHQKEDGDDTHLPIDVLHVVGRTPLKPNKYFYRTRVDGAYWTPWEPIDLDIEAEHLLLAVEDRRPHLFWPLIEEQADPEQTIPGDVSQAREAAATHLEIRLAWSERRSGKWTARRTSGGSAVTMSAGFSSSSAFISLVLDQVKLGEPPQIAVLFGAWGWAKSGGHFARTGCGVLEGTDYGLRLPDDFRSFESPLLALPAHTFMQYQDAVLFEGNPTELVVPITLDDHPQSLELFGSTPATFRALVPHVLGEPAGKDRDNAAAGVSFFYKDAGVNLFAEPVLYAHTEWHKASYAPLGGLPFNNVNVNDIVLGRGGLGLGLPKWAKTPPRETYFPRTWEDAKRYRFTPFYHPYVCLFRKELQRAGVDGLLKWSLHPADPLQLRSRDFFAATYQPHPDNVLKPYPIEDVDFSFRGAYALYNWELFFHAPLLIALRLMQSGRHAEAQRWFHFIFDPTTGDPAPVPQRFWKVRPFRENLDLASIAEELESLAEAQQSPVTKLIAAILKIEGGVPAKEDLAAQIEAWQKRPFNPHLIARMRPIAYQKTVVMRYIDNLIAWGDQLFRRETLESINEATQLYVLAAELLGRRPRRVRPRQGQAPQNYWQLEQLGLGDFSDPLVEAESLAGEGQALPVSHPMLEPPPDLGALYFCVPGDDSIALLWDTVADRLFKIRHSMNIEGVFRRLPLFEPPIDPMLLVQATALGVDLAAAIADLHATRLPYRFQVLHAKAMELCGAVAGLGGALLSAMEKKDAEALSRLRSSQEVELVTAAREVKVQQVKEAEASLAALQRSHEAATIRRDHYAKLPQISPAEGAALQMSVMGIELGLVAQGLALVASGVEAVPPVTFGGAGMMGSPLVTTTIGGPVTGAPIEAASRAFSMAAGLLQEGASVAATLAGYERRAEEWKLQERLAAKEMQQLDKQIAAAKIRVAIAEVELLNHERQIEHAREVFEFLRDKRTTEELYDWMVAELASVHYQTYALAYDLAKRAEQALRFELGTPDGTPRMVRFGHWDSLKQGLLAGERLQHDLRRVEVAFLEQTRRDAELTKHVSLAEVAPDKLVELRETGSCTFELKEEVFDLDYPGHYFRRIKSVAVTIPAVTGPYAGVSCTLTLSGSKVRKEVLKQPYASSVNFREDLVPLTNVILTSSGVNDPGLFEPTLRDERYLPFEGAGVLGTYQLDLPAANNRFDVSAINDVILHIRYTARSDGGITEAAKSYYGSDSNAPRRRRLLSVRSELPFEWARFMTASPQQLCIPLVPGMFPYVPATRKIVLTNVTFYARWNGKVPYTSFGALKIQVTPVITTLPPEEPPTGNPPLFTLKGYPDNAQRNTGCVSGTVNNLALGTWTIDVDSNAVEQIAPQLRTGGRLDETLQDIQMLCEYKLVPALP